MSNPEITPRIFLIGANGQVGHAWQSLLPDGQLVGVDRQTLDLSQTESLAQRLHEQLLEAQPTAIVNAAAYTAVDQAEDHEQRAYDINTLAPGIIAGVAARLQLPLIHYSTDYVFDGQGEQPFVETDVPAPLSVYGRSKLAGEQAVQAAGGAHLIFRTSWVFGVHGQNFLKTMLRLAQARDRLSVVNDQIGAPTSAHLLASVPLQLLDDLHDHQDPRWGLYHLCPTGYTSWHGYACYVIARARALGWRIKVADDAIDPVASSEFPVKAPRPKNSRLCTEKLQEAFGLTLPSWQSGVDEVLAQLAQLDLS